MAHYAILDENNVVVDAFVGVDETELIDGLEPELWYEQHVGQKCRRYSLNTRGNEHLTGKTPFRKNPGGIGWVYNEEHDGFHEPQPHQSWVLDPDTCLWRAPVAKPSTPGYWKWDEENQTWYEVPTTFEE